MSSDDEAFADRLRQVIASAVLNEPKLLYEQAFNALDERDPAAAAVRVAELISELERQHAAWLEGLRQLVAQLVNSRHADNTRPSGG